MSIYIASKVRHALRWRELRDAGMPIACTWIDHDVDSEDSAKCEQIWLTAMNEIQKAHSLILYAEPDETLKGALVEVGAAVMAQKPIFAVGDIEALKTARFHPLIKHCSDLDIAFEVACAVQLWNEHEAQDLFDDWAQDHFLHDLDVPFVGFKDQVIDGPVTSAMLRFIAATMERMQ